MKISLVGPTFPYRGGIAHHTTLLCRTLRKSHEVQFLSFERQYPAFIYPGRSDRDPSDEPVRDTEVTYLLDPVNPLSWRRTAQAIIRFAPDLVILPWWVAFWAPPFLYLLHAVRRRTGARVCIICHNVVEHESNPLKGWLTRSVLSRSDRLITHSAAETEKLRNLVGAEHEVVTAFHPTYSAFNIGRWDRDGARTRLDLQGRVLLFFGFVRDYKGLSVLLDALPRVLATTPVTLLVVGEFWDDKERYLEQLERLRVGAYVRVIDEYVPNERVGEYFAAADLVVQPYKSATGSGIVQLAYGFDRPVIATDVGSLSEVVQDGVNGRLVSPGDPHALAEAIIQSLEPGTLRRYTRNASSTKDRFSWDRFSSLLVSEESGLRG